LAVIHHGSYIDGQFPLCCDLHYHIHFKTIAINMKSTTLFFNGLGLISLSFSNPIFYKSSVRGISPAKSLANRIPAAAGTTCATGIHMIVARASTELPGQGIIGEVASLVEQAIPGSDSVAVDYPATLFNYADSEAQGIAAMTELIEAYATACPDTKMALLGYSQVSSSRKFSNLPS
jgi:hypothetical protein